MGIKLWHKLNFVMEMPFQLVFKPGFVLFVASTDI